LRPTASTTIAAERRQRAGRALFDRIGDGEKSGRDAVDREQHDALAVLPQFLRACGQACRLDAEGCEKSRIADGDPSSLDDPDDAFPGL
jgi:hypothetical protein